ncbi:MAG: hypothetical protein COY80_04090 [Candidatus Pacebacteria bacterium CG_4_10_14_0_8_um_filter_42_14]|nr:MAG: hypothetical protein COY80_04090 [Candidatus Pacebacteria bacterium CG_4_10_14_0_8_um_filter_42_14]
MFEQAKKIVEVNNRYKNDIASQDDVATEIASFNLYAEMNWTHVGWFVADYEIFDDSISSLYEYLLYIKPILEDFELPRDLWSLGAMVASVQSNLEKINVEIA